MEGSDSQEKVIRTDTSLSREIWIYRLYDCAEEFDLNKVEETLSRKMPIKRLRLSSVDIAEVAATSTTFATNQECSFFIFQALKDVRAGSFLADGMKTFSFYERTKSGVFRAHVGASLNPLGLSFNGSLSITCFDAK